MDQIIKSRAFQRIVYVGGYKFDAIKSHMNSHYPTVEFLPVENLQYYNTNAILSLYLASLQELSDDYVVLNGDTIAKAILLARLASTENELSLVAAKKERYEKDDMKIHVSGNGRLCRISKGIEDREADCFARGLASVKGEGAKLLIASRLNKKINDEKGSQMYWMEIFNDDELKNSLSLFFTSEDDAFEIDSHDDLRDAGSWIRGLN